MIFEVEDLEALQRWLEIHLKPLCDADPQALTRYVIALLKKDQPEDALRITMAHQLEIFLQDATSPFLDRLFSCINSGEYRNSVQKVLISENKNPIDSEATLRSEQIINKDEKQACQSSTFPKMSESRRRVSESSEEFSSSDDDETKSSDVCQQKIWRDKRSRSVSIEISPHRKRNRLERGRSGFITRSNRLSPSKRRARGEMSLNNHRLPGSANRRRYRSPSRRSAGSNRSRSRSISLSPIRRRKVRPPSPSESNSLLENITTKCSVKSVVVKPTSTSLVGPNDRYLTSKGRCPDYDEQGVCMLGDCCPFDHGSDPVILNDVRNSETSPPGPFYQKPTSDEYFPESPVFTGGAPRFVGWGPGLVRRPIRTKTVYMNQFLHRGNIMRHGMLRNLGPPMMCPPRQLVPVPVDGNILRGHVPPPGYIPENPFAHLGPRVGVRSPFGNRGRSLQPIGRVNIRQTNPDLNSCLAVRKIPRAMNTIEGLINHFSRFGNVVTIQVGFDGDPEGALVVFQSHHDALLAYRSTEAVLNNRFIRVFWHNQEVDTTSQSATGSIDIPAETHSLTHASERSNENRQSRHESNNEAAVRLKSAVLSLPATVDSTDGGTQILNDTSECVTSTVASATEVPPTRMFRKGLLHSKPSEARKQEMVTLLNSHLNEQKQLILKYEADKKRMTPKQRDELLQVIKNLQTSCEQLKCEIAKFDSFKAPGNSEERVPIPSQDEMKRTILDQELEDYMWERKRYDPDQNKPLSD